MKCTIPEISWHNRDPVLSIDIQPKKPNELFTRIASGGTDTHVLIWHLRVEPSGVASVECAADLTRHNKPVNIVRFSPSGEFLASGDDDASIIVWKQKTVNDAPDIFANTDSDEFKEQWLVERILRGHLQDVFDICWSPDSKNLVSGSVDNTAIIWDMTNGRNLGILTDHKGFVQGVAWDPCKQYVATISSDRVCRIFNATTRRIVSRISKARLPGTDADVKPVHLFHDDTIKTFFRRLTFTPDGELLIVPTGIIEQHEVGEKPLNSTVIFKRNSFTKPVAYLPSLKNFSVAVRCCPVLFKLRPMTENPLFDLQYRIVIAVATQSNIILYDTQHVAPFAFIANIHYTRLTDLSWSQDGKILVVSSTDGYCSIITFGDGELGEVYPEKQSSETETQNTKEMEETSKKLKSKKDDQDNSKPSGRNKDGSKVIITENESVNKSTIITQDEEKSKNKNVSDEKSLEVKNVDEKMSGNDENLSVSVDLKTVKGDSETMTVITQDEEKNKNQSVPDEKSLEVKKVDETISGNDENLSVSVDLKTVKDDSETMTNNLTSEKEETLVDIKDKKDHDSTKAEILASSISQSEEVAVDSAISTVGMEATSVQEVASEKKSSETVTGVTETIDKDEKPIDMEVERRGEVTPTKHSSMPNKDKDGDYKSESPKISVLEKMDVDNEDLLQVDKCKTDSENKHKMDVDQDFHLHYEDSMTEALKNKNNEASVKTEKDADGTESSKKENASSSFTCVKPNPPVTPGRKTPRRVQLITLSSPKNKKK